MSRAFRIDMTGAQENPANASTATGLGVAIYDDSGVPFLEYTIVVRGLDWGPFSVPAQPQQTAGTADNVIDAHFHQAARGVNGGVKFGWKSQDTDDFTITGMHLDGGVPVATVGGRWEETDPTPSMSIPHLSGFASSFTSPMSVGSDTDFYANIHTSAIPGGEIRGQLVLLSTDGDDIVDGVAGDRDDILPGLGGNDTISGFGGNDTLTGGSGDDSLTGGAGRDSVQGGSGNDELYVVAGDVVAGETYDGGSDFDDLYVSGANDFTGTTLLSIEGLEFGVALPAGATFTSNQIGGGGLSSMLAVEGDAAANAITVNLVGASLNLAFWTFTDWDVLNDTITINGAGTAETVVGSQKDDTINGNGGADLLIGHNGNDALDGGPGNDTLYGQWNDDSLNGGDGNDALFGGEGADALDGGDGMDYARYDGATVQGVVVRLATSTGGEGEALGDTFESVEGVYGSFFDDDISGDGGANDLRGLHGNDILWGLVGNDTLLGGNGMDTLDGGADNDLLYGQEADDTLNGGLGRDSLFGGAGVDSLTGGAGADLFYFIRGEANGDQLTDFDGQGAALGDRLMFAGYGVGATFVNLNETDWQINSGDGMTSEVITFLNSASVHASDFTFV